MTFTTGSEQCPVMEHVTISPQNAQVHERYYQGPQLTCVASDQVYPESYKNTNAF